MKDSNVVKRRRERVSLGHREGGGEYGKSADIGKFREGKDRLRSGASPTNAFWE